MWRIFLRNQLHTKVWWKLSQPSLSSRDWGMFKPSYGSFLYINIIFIILNSLFHTKRQHHNEMHIFCSFKLMMRPINFLVRVIFAWIWLIYCFSMKRHINYIMSMSNPSSEFAFCWWKYCCHCYYLSCWYYFIQVTKFISSCNTFKKLEYYNCKINFIQYYFCAYFVQNR